MSENRSLSVLEVLVHLSDTLPDKYVLGRAEIPEDVTVEALETHDLPNDWATLAPGEQDATRRLGDNWIRRNKSAALSVPSVTSGERNFVMNPAHPEFSRIVFHDPIPFRFDPRLVRNRIGVI